MKISFKALPIIVSGILICCSASGFQADNDSLFINPLRIIISSKTLVEPTPAEVEWAKELLEGLEIEDRSNFEKAEKILRYISETYKYRIKSPRTISGFNELEGGNCVSHTIAGLFLLRMAGIPAKFCYEYHVKNWMVVDRWRANANKAAYYGAGHNSHYWVLFFDGTEWQPYDSALGICGFDQFYNVRTSTKRWPYFISLNPKRMTGAPFIIMVETGYGSKSMVNITSDIWRTRFEWNNSKVTKEEWDEFLHNFSGLDTKDFIYPVDDQLATVIRRMSLQWF